ncbi:MAG: queuine tRNA-ribosyltransferase [Thermoactinomyces sp.]
MEFYISWSHSDAKFSHYFNECPMLISTVPDNNRPLKKLKKQPNKLIIDSGAIFYAKYNKVSVQEIFHKQLDILQDATSSIKTIKLVQLDVPLFDKKNLSAKYGAMEKNLYFAWEYINLFKKSSLPSKIQPMAVIQGFDKPSIEFCILELRKMGYQYLGIGSLLTKNPKEQLSLIQAAVRLIGTEYLHVFGVSGLEQIKKMASMKNITSFDSSRPTKAVAYYSVFYSNPFRTYILGNSRVAKSGPRLDKPLPCSCPVCLNNPHDILIPSPRHYMKLRSIHNYYHLNRTIQTIVAQNERMNPCVVSNVLRT